MAHHEILFPTNISYGGRGGPMFRTTIVTLDSGVESRIGRQSGIQHKYDVAYGVKSMDDLFTVKEFFIGRMGALHSFNYKDFLDYTTASNGRSAHAATDVNIGSGDVSGTVAFQILKKYTSGSITRNRNLTKIVNGTVLVTVNAVLKTEITHYTVNNETGIITFVTAPPDGHVVTCGCEFYVPVRFSESTDEWLSVEHEDFDNGEVSIEVVEVVNELDLPEEYFYGGAAEEVLSADRLISVGEARLWVFAPDASGHKVKLPDETNLQPGGPYFFIVNTHATRTIEITKSDETAIVTLAGSSALTVVLSKSSGGTKVWYTF